MIRINLSPRLDQSRGKFTILRDVIIISALSYGAYAGLEYYSKSFDIQISNLERKISELQRTKANLKKDIERAQEIRSRSDQIKQRSLRVRQLGEGRKMSVILLDTLQSKHPERMWFTKISYISKTKTLTLSGFALDHTVIADYMKRLREMGKVDASDYSELKDFIPPQLLSSEIKKTIAPIESRQEYQTLDQVNLKQLNSSEEIQGLTLQKFEISMRISNG